MPAQELRAEERAKPKGPVGHKMIGAHPAAPDSSQNQGKQRGKQQGAQDGESEIASSKDRLEDCCRIRGLKPAHLKGVVGARNRIDFKDYCNFILYVAHHTLDIHRGNSKRQKKIKNS